MSIIQMNTLKRILKERKRQDAKWGEQNHDPRDWLPILGEEFGELCKAINETTGCGDKVGTNEEIKEEAVHVAAVAIAMIESMERNEM
jgi:NTP pyrophosphatase (non-canonical NTP hydrolase)